VTTVCPLCGPAGDVEVERGVDGDPDYCRCLRCSLAGVRDVWARIEKLKEGAEKWDGHFCGSGEYSLD
jgi:hypothetical protein